MPHPPQFWGSVASSKQASPQASVPHAHLGSSVGPSWARAPCVRVARNPSAEIPAPPPINRRSERRVVQAASLRVSRSNVGSSIGALVPLRTIHWHEYWLSREDLPGSTLDRPALAVRDE